MEVYTDGFFFRFIEKKFLENDNKGHKQVNRDIQVENIGTR